MAHPFLLLALICSAACWGQQSSQRACNLLTPAELETAIGGHAAHGTETETPYKKSAHIDHDGVLYECKEPVGARRVTLRFTTTGISEEGKKQGADISNDAQKWMRDQGYQIQVKEVNGSRCTTILPFAGAKGNELLPVGTTCVLKKGAYMVSIAVSATGSSDVVSMEKLATLADKAASRFPAR
jgi:hypothetical protein